MKLKLTFLSLIFVLLTHSSICQNDYQYSIDLTQVENDQLKVLLKTPEIEDESIEFYMPKIIPGTYRESNFGRFISELKAFDKKGNELLVTRVDQNKWKIDNAKNLETISYWVEDIFDTEIQNKIYRMAATNIEVNENFVISTPGFFGYFADLKEIPFKISISKPKDFYASTGLQAVSTSENSDVFVTSDYDELIDSPIMYNIPDVTKFYIEDTEVIVSVYAKKGLIKSKMIAEKLEPLLRAEAKYLGGDLPTDKYAFIMYFEDPAKTSPLQGALEHNISSFYYLPELPAQNILPSIIDIAAHEFFHIVTPLTIHSEEIEDFNYNSPDLSQHLWLYEGVTEYASDHLQVKYGLISQLEYLRRLAGKINNAHKNFNSFLPFTELSKYAATKYADQYHNVYEKGALIAALLDIRLLELTKGKISLMDMLNLLSSKYGKDKPFKDEDLFEDIAELTNPDILDFFESYVAGSSALPLEEYFQKVGVKYYKEQAVKKASMGSVGLGYDQESGHFVVIDTSKMNDFGKKIGYRIGDLIYSVNGEELDPITFSAQLAEFQKNTNESENVEIEIGRKNQKGEYERIKKSAPALVNMVPGQAVLSFVENPTKLQLHLRNLWLSSRPANPEDVESIDALLNAFYEVISGPAGKRDWDRFLSLFSETAKMTSLSPNQAGETVMNTIAPEDYIATNSPFMMKNGFWESELGRNVIQFENAATVASTYGFSLQEDSEPTQRGVNFLNLAYENDRWWITSLLWNHETPENPIPEELLSH